MQQGVVQAYPAGVGVAQHMLLARPVITEVVQCQRARALVDVGQRLVEAVVGHQRQQRAEDFVLHHLHAVVHVQQQVRWQAPALAGFAWVQVKHLRTFVVGIVQQVLQALQLAGLMMAV